MINPPLPTDMMNAPMELPTQQGLDGATTVNVPGESQMKSKVSQLVEEAKKARFDLTREWRKYRRWYEGRQWKKGRPSYKVSNVINIIFSNIETVLPLMLDDVPRLEAKPRSEETYPIANKITATFNFLHKKIKLNKSIKRVIKDSLMYGSGIYKVIWDEDKEPRYIAQPAVDPLTGEVMLDEMGQPQMNEQRVYMGEVGVLRVSPFFIYPDPTATCIEDAGYIIEGKPVDIDYIRRKYPERGWEVKPENVDVALKQQALWEDGPVIVDPTHARPDLAEGEKTGWFKRDRVMLYEIWIKNLGLLVPKDIEQGFDYQGLYEANPGGRVITYANGVILRDIPNPFMDNKYPYVKDDDYELDDTFFGMGEVKNVLTLQKEINKRSSQLIENAQLLGNPKVLNPQNSGVDTDTLTSRPGEILTYNIGFEPKYLVPPSLPTYIFDALKESKIDVEMVSGIHDITQGRKPTGITAAAAIAELQEAGHTRVREKLRNRNDALEEVGELMLSRMRQFYDIPRQIRIMGGEGMTFQIIHNEELGGMYDVEVMTGTGIPVSQASKFQQAIALYELQAIDEIALLEAANWPQRDKIRQRMEAKRQEEMMMQQQMMEQQMQQQMMLQQAQTEGKLEQEAMRQGMLPPPEEPMPPDGMPPEMIEEIQGVLGEAAMGRAEVPPELAEGGGA